MESPPGDNDIFLIDHIPPPGLCAGQEDGIISAYILPEHLLAGEDLW